MSLSLETHVDFLPNLPGSRPCAPVIPKRKKSFLRTLYGGTRFVVENPTFQIPELVKQNMSTSLSMGFPYEQQRHKKTHMVCSFTGYFKEGIYDSRDENNRVRLCNVIYYTNDDTIEIQEPKQENAAIPQGKFLRRHKVLKNEQGDHYTLEDLDVGKEVAFYGRNLLLVDANGSTRRYFADVLGRELGPALPLPKDEYTEKKKIQMSRETGRDPSVSHHILKNPMTGFAEAKLGKMIDHSARAGFLKYNRACLRFDAVWDDRERLYGDLLMFRIHYFLADNTMEVAAVHTRNDGRGDFGLLVKRGKILKDESNPYTWTDFYIGAEIDIYTRKLHVIDADPFTRRFFDSQDMSLGPRIILPEEELPRYQREIPPHTGYGSEEDSLTSCPGHSLVISRPRIVRDVREDRCLSYKALLVSDRVRAQ